MKAENGLLRFQGMEGNGFGILLFGLLVHRLDSFPNSYIRQELYGTENNRGRAFPLTWKEGSHVVPPFG